MEKEQILDKVLLTAMILVERNRVDEALKIADDLLYKANDLYEEMDPKLAKYYFLLGHTILTDLEIKIHNRPTPSHHLLDIEFGQNEEESILSKIVYENLAVSQAILQNQINDINENDLELLSRINHRLGDYFSMQGQSEQSIDHYRMELDYLKERIDQKLDMKFYQLYYKIGFTICTKQKSNKQDFEQSLEYFQQAIQIVNNNLDLENSVEKQKELNSCLEAIQEMIDEVVDSINNCFKQTDNINGQDEKKDHQNNKIIYLGEFGNSQKLKVQTDFNIQRKQCANLNKLDNIGNYFQDVYIE